jgi:hypothetical protein
MVTVKRGLQTGKNQLWDAAQDAELRAKRMIEGHRAVRLSAACGAIRTARRGKKGARNNNQMVSAERL